MSAAQFIPAAETDLKESYEYYDARDHDLALQFMMCVRQTVDAIEKAPLRLPIAAKDMRKAPVSKFPFAVWYVTDGDSVIVACLHSKRDGRKIALERLRALGPAPQ